VGNTTTNTNSSKLVVNGTISQTVSGTQYLVVDQSDVGTAPNQIPLNQYLGSMAFQDRENVNFTGGTGALSSLDIAAISAQLNVSAVDVFVYDTAKDSDGGAWRKRTQHTSWYNETLNTATRGARREFPAVAVIIITPSTITIYDGDAPDLPMWMVFYYTATSGWNTSLFPLTGASNPVTSVTALNGTIAVATTAQTIGLVLVKLISDNTFIYCTAQFGGIDAAPLVLRNTSGHTFAAGGTSNLPGLSSIYVNDVAVTVLPNAPVDSTTGLPVPTIAVATAAGANVIHNNGTVISISTTDANWTNFRKVSFLGSRMVINPSFTGAVNNSMFYTFDIPYTSITFSSINADIPNVNALYYHSDSSIPNVLLTTPLWNSDIVGGEILAKGGNSGLNFIREDLASKSGITSKGMVAYATTKYNTGWMPGNIKGAWLSDTTQETVVGAQLIPNGTSFAGATGTTPPTGWTSTGASYTASANVLSITTSAVSNVAATISLTGLIPGKTYQLSMDASGGYFRVFGTNHDSVRSLSGTRTTQLYNIVTTSTALDININYGSANSTGTLANVSLRLADLDRSVNAAPLQTFGSITKTPVATGADLVSYSGFSSTNYLEQLYNSGFDFGTGDFCVSGWARNDNNTASTQAIISRGGGGERGFQIWRTTSSGATYTNSLYVRVTTSAGDSIYSNGIDKTIFLNGVWNHIVLLRRAGTVFVYFNNLLVLSFANAGTLNPNATPSLIFGTPNTTANEMSLALWKVSASAPSDAQITKMYNDEKYLFQENAKATLYGTSDAVNAVAYDADTQLLHAGTSSGRSVFDGLRRVDNTTTAVATAISAADGLVVEN
jgi:hypothetical protein